MTADPDVNADSGVWHESLAASHCNACDTPNRVVRMLTVAGICVPLLVSIAPTCIPGVAPIPNAPEVSSRIIIRRGVAMAAIRPSVSDDVTSARISMGSLRPWTDDTELHEAARDETPDDQATPRTEDHASHGVSPHQASPETAGCPTGMVEVKGEYCPAVEQICEKWIDERKDRCERYRPKVRCVGKARPRHYCIDRYEFPNEEGTTPTVAVSWEQAERYCTAEGKRLCTDEEWTLACEGPERWPYPYGFERDATACNVDRDFIPPREDAYDDPRTRASEVSRLSQSEPSGARQRCRSPYGVHDMTGNADEWIRNETGSMGAPPYDSGLKGGHWGKVRNRCRPMTTDHSRWYHGYQTGFRCCSAAVSAPLHEGNESSIALVSNVALARQAPVAPPPYVTIARVGRQ